MAVSLAATFAVAGELSAQQISDFRSSLSNAFGRASWGQASWGVMVVSLDAGDTLFAVEPDSALAPASNLKILTSAAALRALGTEYRFRTYVITNGKVDGGIVDGDLILYGTGDPGISDRFYPRKDEVFRRDRMTVGEPGVSANMVDHCHAIVGQINLFYQTAIL